MISYNWKHQQTAVALAAQLRQLGVEVWIDLEKMKAEVMESMAEAVSGSSTVIILVSEAYKSSAACKCEAMYAFELKKRIVPLVAETAYVADGWLGALVAGRLRYDVSTELQLVKELPKIAAEVTGVVAVAKAGPVSGASRLKNKDDVAAWLTSVQLGFASEAFAKQDMVDGAALELLLHDFAAFVPLLGDLGLATLGQKLKFHAALHTLCGGMV
jgi:hypothetical protein